MLKRMAALMLATAFAASAAAEDRPAPAVKPAEPAIERRMANAVQRLAVSPDGKWIAASDARGALTLFSAETNQVRSIVPAGPATFEQLLFTGDGSVLVAVPCENDDRAKVIRLISVADGKQLGTLDVSTTRQAKPSEPAADPLFEIGAEPGGSKVRLLRQANVEIWDAATGKKVESRKNEPYAQASVRSSDEALTAGGVTSQFWIVETASAKQRWKVDLERVTMSGKKVDTMWTGTCRVLGFTDQARLLLVFSDVEETKDPSATTGQSLEKRTKKTTSVEARSAADGTPAWHHDVSDVFALSAVFVAPDTVAIVDDGKLALLNAANGELRENAPATAKYSCVAATPDGLTFWAGTDDGRVVKVKTFVAPKAK